MDSVVIKHKVGVGGLDWNGRFDVVVRLTGKSYYRLSHKSCSLITLIIMPYIVN